MAKENKIDVMKKMVEEGYEYMWFCPLINGDCRPDCICFVPAKEEEIPDKYAEEPRYRTVPARCANKLLGG